MVVMKNGSIVFLVLAFCSFVSAIVSFSSMPTVGFVAFMYAGIAFLQMIAWILIGWMYETLMQ